MTVEKIIYTVLDDGTYGSRSMTVEELTDYEELITTPFVIADRINEA